MPWRCSLQGLYDQPTALTLLNVSAHLARDCWLPKAVEIVVLERREGGKRGGGRNERRDGERGREGKRGGRGGRSGREGERKRENTLNMHTQ